MVDARTAVPRTWCALCCCSLLVAAAAFVGGDHGAVRRREGMTVVALREQRRGRRDAPDVTAAAAAAGVNSGSHLKSKGSGTAAVLELKHGSSAISRKFSHGELLAADDARAASIQSTISARRTVTKLSSEAELPLTSGVRLQTLNYVTAITVGGVKHTVIVDTGSDLTWIQCKPCASCYIQQDPLFDPATSPSYAAVQCNSSYCAAALRSATGSPGACAADTTSCSYDLSYGDGSYTRGVLAVDSVGLGEGIVVDRLLFGCGRSNRGLFGGTSGLIGLGRSEISLVSQTVNQFAGVFSYCMPVQTSATGSLTLGTGMSAFRNTTPITFTPMISDPDQSPFYFLNMTAITVGGITVESSAFATGRTLIDSGTVITRLPPSSYQALKAEFMRQFTGYPTTTGFSILDTCFDLSAYPEVAVPELKLSFEGGGELRVDVAAVLYFVKKDASQACLAIAELRDEGEVGIIGNYQQKNRRVVYDTDTGKLGFAEEDCGDHLG